MALQKTLITSVGVTAEYWKVDSVLTIYPKGKKETKITLIGYHNSAVRNDPRYQAMGSASFMVTADADFPENADSFTREQAYAYIKAKPISAEGLDFSNAQDC